MISNSKKGTSFMAIYNSFLSKVTADMYMELTEHDTYSLLQELLINAIPWFKLPKQNIYEYELGYIKETEYCGVESDFQTVPATYWVDGTFYVDLTFDEINILSHYMVVEWLGQQLASTENARMRYTGADFKMTSQANHMAKIKVVKESYISEAKTLVDGYKRRKIVDGIVRSTLDEIMLPPDRDF